MTVVLFTADTLPSYAPTVAEVAALVRARTKVPGGSELGTFSAQTRPTDTDVRSLIAEALNEVLGKAQTPTDPASAYAAHVASAAKVYAAMLIELSFFPEQVRSDRSAYAPLKDLYDMRIRALISEGETGGAQGMGEGATGAGDAPADASWAFPADPYGFMVGWSTRW